MLAPIISNESLILSLGGSSQPSARGGDVAESWREHCTLSSGIPKKMMRENPVGRAPSTNGVFEQRLGWLCVQRVPSVLTSLLYVPSTSNGVGHWATKRLARVRPDSSSAADRAIAPKAQNRNRCEGSFAACCSITRVNSPSPCSGRTTATGAAYKEAAAAGLTSSALMHTAAASSAPSAIPDKLS